MRYRMHGRLHVGQKHRGYNVGKGIIHVEKMAVSDHIHSKEAEICFGEKCGITKGQELVQECIRAVHAKEDAK